MPFNRSFWRHWAISGAVPSPPSLSDLPGSMVPANRQVPHPLTPKPSRFPVGPVPLRCCVWVPVISHGLCDRIITQMPAPGMTAGLFSRHWDAGKSQTKPKNTAHGPRHHLSATDGFGFIPLFCGSAEKCLLTQDVILKGSEMSNHPLAGNRSPPPRRHAFGSRRLLSKRNS